MTNKLARMCVIIKTAHRERERERGREREREREREGERGGACFDISPFHFRYNFE